MAPESSAYISLVVILYVLAALAVVFWVYLTTKIVVSIFSKERVGLRIICWPIIAWFSALVLYMVFVIAIGLFGVAIESLIDLLKWNT